VGLPGGEGFDLGDGHVQVGAVVAVGVELASVDEPVELGEGELEPFGGLGGRHEWLVGGRGHGGHGTGSDLGEVGPDEAQEGVVKVFPGDLFGVVVVGRGQSGGADEGGGDVEGFVPAERDPVVIGHVEIVSTPLPSVKTFYTVVVWCCPSMTRWWGRWR